MSKKNLPDLEKVISGIKPILILRLVIFISLVGIFFRIPLFDLESTNKILGEENNRTLNLILLMFVFLMTFFLPRIFKFLKYTSTDDRDRTKRVVNRLAKKLYELEGLDNNVKGKLTEYIDKNLTVKEIQEAVYKKTLERFEDDIIQRVGQQYQKMVANDVKLSAINSYLQPLENNIQRYIDKLQNNSIVNLLIGIVGTTVSIVSIIIVLFSKNDYTDLTKFLIFFLPRLTFVISIQLFAFFFLRLYRNNLEDAKYFQNELSNVNSKIAALKVAALMGGEDRLTDILEKLSSVERNFVLHKDDTLLNIERSKIERDVDLELIKSFKETFNIFKKEKIVNGKVSEDV